MSSLKVIIALAILLCGVVIDCKQPDHIVDDQRQSEFDKEVLLTDEDDEMSDIKKLSTEEQKEKLKILVEKKIDTNHDGFVDEAELTNWALKAFDIFETEDTKHEFPELDTDEDQYLTWDEYSTNTFGEDFDEDSEEFKNPETDEWKSFVQSYKTDKKMFEAADEDSDGKLSLSEYIVFKHPRLSEKTKKIYIEDALQRIDTNGDGQVDLKEFLGEYKKTSGENQDPDWVEVETEKFKEDFDINKDGVLTEDEGEISSWLTPDNYHLAQEEAEHIIHECDTNDDKKLAIAEILGKTELWIKSDVTDYGKLLTTHEEL